MTQSHVSRPFHALIPLVLAIGVTPRAEGTALTRNPYVNLVTPASAVVVWNTDVATTGTVVYSTDLSYNLSATEATADTIHAVSITGLDPGESYFYRVVAGVDTLTLPSDYFTTAPTPDPGAHFTFAAFGDIGRATPEQIDLAALIEASAPDFAILTGDIIYEAGEPQNFNPQYFNVYKPTIARIPFYTSLGNHDVVTLGGQPYLDAFHLPSNNPAGTERYYSFDYGNAHFVALEVVSENTVPGAAMLTWLDQDLAATTMPWKFVFFHVPAYSNAGGHGGDATIAAALEPIFAAHDVDVVFQGHNHFYTRTYPLDSGSPVDQGMEPDYVNPAGTIWITTGGGGRSLYSIVTPLSSIEAYASSTFHFVYAAVAGQLFSLTVIDKDGNVIDSATITKSIPTAVALADFQAYDAAEGIRLRWQRTDGGTDGGFNLYRSPAYASGWARLNESLLMGGGPWFEFVDRGAEAGASYSYRLGIVDGSGKEILTGAITASRAAAMPRFALGRAHPNPARDGTELSLTLERPAPTRVVIVNAAGRRVRTLLSRAIPAGQHPIAWDGRNDRGVRSPAGVYFIVARSGDREARARVALLR